MSILFVVLIGLCMLWVERRWPGWRVPLTGSYLRRALGLNLVQLGLVLLFGVSVDRWLAARPLWCVGLEGVGGALLGYLAITFAFYWWHRARHGVPWRRGMLNCR